MHRSRGIGAAVSVALYVVSVALGLLMERQANATGLLLHEEASVAFRDGLFLEFRLQHSFIATNFWAQLYFWAASHVDPGSVGVFYGRTAKVFGLALVAPLAFLVAHRRFELGRVSAVAAGLGCALVPGVAAYSWIATESGLETVWGLLAMLIASTRTRFGMVGAGAAAGLAVGTYGPGLAFAAVAAVDITLWWWPRRRSRADGTVAGVAVATGLAFVAFPLLWWTNGPHVVTGGGGEVSTVLAADHLEARVREIFVAGRSYYYWSTAPFLGTTALAVAATAALVILLPWARRWWPLYLLVTIPLGLDAVAGPPAPDGIRRAVPLAAGAMLAVAGVIDLAARRLPRGTARSRALVAAAGVVLVVAGTLPGWIATRDGLRDGARRLDREVGDMPWPSPEIASNVAVLEQVTADLRSGALSLSTLRCRPGLDTNRLFSVMWVLADRNGEPPPVSRDIIRKDYLRSCR